MNSIGIIPARYASTRFPAKPLVDIRGKLNKVLSREGATGELIMNAKDSCIMAPGSGSAYPTRGSGGPHDNTVVPYNTLVQFKPFVETISGDSIYFEAISNYIAKQFPRDHVLGMKKFSIKKWKKWKKGNDCYTFMGSK